MEGAVIDPPPRFDRPQAYPFPLRAGYMAQVVLPRDMTKKEAERLCAFVMSLAKPEAK
jgi:hypothetical protein